MNINHVVISGRLTHDPDIKSSMKGTMVLSFTVACNQSRKNEQGAWEDIPNYFDATMFGSRAEYFSKKLSKGSLVCVSGKLNYQTWERDGQKRSKVSILAEDIEVLSQQQQQPAYEQQTYAPVYQPPQPQQYAPQPQAAQGYYYQPPTQEQQPQYNDVVYSEDVPF